MARPATARVVALRDQVLAVLKAEEGFPLLTAEVAKRCGKSWCAMGTDCDHPHHDSGLRDTFVIDVYPVLNWLAERGLVEKVTMGLIGSKVYWRAS